MVLQGENMCPHGPDISLPLTPQPPVEKASVWTLDWNTEIGVGASWYRGKGVLFLSMWVIVALSDDTDVTLKKIADIGVNDRFEEWTQWEKFKKGLDYK